jgi:hypothetical protein
MKFDVAIQALVHTTWDWTEDGFEAVVGTLGLVREADADPEMPVYVSPWGKEWVQAIVEDGSVQRLELLVEDKSPAWRPFTSRKLAALGRKFRDKLDVYAKRVAAVKGTPTFQGESGASGFPPDEDAHVLALWPAENARLMLTMRNEGRDTPFWISIVLRPPATGRTPPSRPSAPAMLGPSTRPSAPSLYAPPRRPSTSAVFRPGTARPLNDASPLNARFVPALEAIASNRWDWSPEALPAQLEPIGLAPAAGPDPLRLEFVLESTRKGGLVLDQEYCEKFERYVEAAKEILGRPTFNDGMAARDFPEDERAQFIALWPLKTARVMVMYRHEDDDDAYTLSIVVKPR